MYDVTDGRASENVSTWRRDLRRICGNIPIALCGNKDDEDNKKVDPKMIRFGEKKFHISVKNNHNLKTPFLFLIKVLLGDPSLHFVENNTLDEAQTFEMRDPIPHFVVNNPLPVPEVEMQDASIRSPKNTALASPVAHIDPAMQMLDPNLHFAENAAPGACIYRADRRLHESLVSAAPSTGKPLNNGIVDDGCTTIEFTCCCLCRLSFKQNRPAP